VALHDGTTVRLIDLETGTDRHVLPASNEFINVIVFSGDGNLLAVQGNSEVEVWNVATGNKQFALARQSRPPDSQVSVYWVFSFDEQNRLLCQVMNKDHAPGVARFAADGASHELLFQGSLTNFTFASADGTLFAAGHDANLPPYGIDIWSAKSKSVVQRLPGHALPVRAMAFSSDNKLLATGAENGEVMIWDLKFPE
jgi:WD40 repeat protein